MKRLVLLTALILVSSVHAAPACVTSVRTFREEGCLKREITTCCADSNGSMSCASSVETIGCGPGYEVPDTKGK